MKSAIFEGEVLHDRVGTHAFRRPLYGYVFDLDDLPALDRELPLFGYNRARPISLHDGDYLARGEGTLRAKLRGLVGEVGRVLLVTSARYLGAIFNPVSFYFCYGPDGALACVVAEVNNTFGERHAYVLNQPEADSQGFYVRYRQPKTFYVSPFNGVEGDYEFLLADVRERVDIRMRLYQEGRLTFTAWLRGSLRPLSTRAQVDLICRYPLNPWMTLPRIHQEAFVLYFRKHLPLVSKRRPVSPVRAEPPTLVHRGAQNAVRRLLEPLRSVPGPSLSWDLPNGEVWRYGDGPGATLRVQNYDLFPRLVWDGDVGLGDAFVAGQWDADDPTAVLTWLLEHRLDDRRLGATRTLALAWGRLRHFCNRNTPGGSRRNIAAHYDLGNDLYRRFLDPTMTYSSAVYAPDDDLETAQRRKLDGLIRRARLGPDDHVLELGCGWGGLAIAAVQATGCRWTGVTLSTEQLAWAQAAVRAAGLEERITLSLCDYRSVQGQFSRIISIEMLEAVGHAHLGTYFARLERLLAPDGLVVLQVITSPDSSYARYRSERDWIQKAIFPGCCIPSLTAISEAMARNSRLRVEELDNIGPHYARTLRDWRERFEANCGGLDERFQRTWRYYFCYCEAAFKSQNLANLQLLLARPQNACLKAEVAPWISGSPG